MLVANVVLLLSLNIEYFLLSFCLSNSICKAYKNNLEWCNSSIDWNKYGRVNITVKTAESNTNWRLNTVIYIKTHGRELHSQGKHSGK